VNGASSSDVKLKQALPCLLFVSAMPPFAVEVHPLAADEAEAAERWYRERNEAASTRFRRELDRCVDLISDRPEAESPSSVRGVFCCAISLLRCIINGCCRGRVAERHVAQVEDVKANLDIRPSVG
jgi:plasmid stabilization system protein ParE